MFLQRLCYSRKVIFRSCFYLDIGVTKSGVGITILIVSAAVTKLLICYWDGVTGYFSLPEDLCYHLNLTLLVVCVSIGLLIWCHNEEAQAKNKPSISLVQFDIQAHGVYASEFWCSHIVIWKMARARFSYKFMCSIVASIQIQIFWICHICISLGFNEYFLLIIKKQTLC